MKYVICVDDEQCNNKLKKGYCYKVEQVTGISYYRLQDINVNWFQYRFKDITFNDYLKLL